MCSSDINQSTPNSCLGFRKQLALLLSFIGKRQERYCISPGIEIDTEWALTMQMLEEGTAGSVLEDHHSCERLVACAVTKQVQQVLMVHSG